MTLEFDHGTKNLAVIYFVILNFRGKKMPGKGQSPRGPQVRMEPEIGGESINAQAEKRMRMGDVQERENQETKKNVTSSKDEMKKVT